MGVPMQSSLVQVPCKSGSPQGVFGWAQVVAAEGDLANWATAGCAIKRKIGAAAVIPSPGNRFLTPLSFRRSLNAHTTSPGEPVQPSRLDQGSLTGLRLSDVD